MAKVIKFKGITWFGIIGINLFGRWILVHDIKDRRALNHEFIHTEQWRELGIFGFMYTYYTEFFVNLWKYRNFKKAYKMITLEIEAYENDHNEHYLKTRKKRQFEMYIKCKKECKKCRCNTTKVKNH